MLFSAQIAATFTNFVSNIALTQSMEPAEFGRFSFCLSVLVTMSLFFEFGVFSAGSRLLALAKEPIEERSTMGALVMLAAAIGIAFGLFVAATAIPIDVIFNQDVRWVLISLAVIVVVQPFQMLVELACQGLNRIRLLSLFQVLASLINLGTIVLLATLGKLNAGTGVAAFLMGTGIGAAVVITVLRPSFTGAVDLIRPALNETRRYGIQIYLARVTATASLRLDNPVIAFFQGRASLDLAPLGPYTIAQRLGQPIATMSRALAVTRFRAFARIDRVSPRILSWNFAILLAVSLGLVLVGPVVIRLFFPPKYSEAIPLLLPFAVLNFFGGLFQPYNVFLTSQGYGKAVRNIALCVAVLNLAGLIIFVPGFGIIGAAWVGAAAMALDYALHVHYYRRSVKLRNE